MLKSGKTHLAAICAAWLLCGVLHVVFYAVDFTCEIVQLFCAAVSIFWGVSIQRRVTDRRLRRLLVGVTACLVLSVSFQAARYSLLWMEGPVCLICYGIYQCCAMPMETG